MHLCIQTPNGTKPINIIKRLMIKGADMQIKDKRGQRPVDICKKRANEGDKFLDAFNCLEKNDP